MTVEEWLRLGLEAGWCGPPVCATHDGTPTSAGEDDAFDDGDDPCLHILRLYPDRVAAAAVEANHPPTVWRR